MPADRGAYLTSREGGLRRTTVVDHYKAASALSQAEIQLGDARRRAGADGEGQFAESRLTVPALCAAESDYWGPARVRRPVRIGYRSFPPAAHACAHAPQRPRPLACGKVLEMHDLRSRTTRAGRRGPREYAKKIGPIPRFKQDMGSDAVQKRVASDRELGMKVGIEATPSFFINGRPFRESHRSLSAYLKEELEL